MGKKKEETAGSGSSDPIPPPQTSPFPGGGWARQVHVGEKMGLAARFRQ